MDRITVSETDKIVSYDSNKNNYTYIDITDKENAGSATVSKDSLDYISKNNENNINDKKDNGTNASSNDNDDKDSNGGVKTPVREIVNNYNYRYYFMTHEIKQAYNIISTVNVDVNTDDVFAYKEVNVPGPMDVVLKLYDSVKNQDSDQFTSCLDPTSQTIIKGINKVYSWIGGEDLVKEVMSEQFVVTDWEVIEYSITYTDDQDSFIYSLLSNFPFMENLLHSEADVHSKVRYTVNGETVVDDDDLHVTRHGFKWLIDVDWFSSYN